MSIKELYFNLWGNLNLFGKCTIYPLFIVLFPLVFIISIGVKK